ncbi:MAG: hypothetical protein ACE5LC_10155 [Candidatus Aminicenantales bacterium]
MKFIQFKDNLKDFVIFSVNDIKMLESNFHRRRLKDWQEKGYIKKVIKGWYIFSDMEIDESSLFEIANRIYKPSYVSLEMALSYHGLIPESTYSVTSISTRRTYAFSTPIGQFAYRTLKRELFFGYEIISFNNRSFKVAYLEKAVLDYLYLNTNFSSPEDFKSLRLNTDTLLSKVSWKRWETFLKKYSNKRFLRRINRFMEAVVPERVRNYA